MRYNFDTDSIRKNEISLIDGQVDLILRSLEFYMYTYQYIYPRHGRPEDKEEELRISLVRDTYHQILIEYGESKQKQPIFYKEDLTTQKDLLEKII